MITALALVCAVETRTDCYTTMYAYMFDTIEQCQNHITESIEQDIFKTTIDGRLYDLYDYRCISWEDGLV